MKRPTGFSAARHAAPEPTGYDFSAASAAGLLAAGAAWVLGSAAKTAPVWALACLALCAGLAALARLRWTAAAVLALTAAFCAACHRAVGAGLLQYANALLLQLTALTGRIHLPLEATDVPQLGWFFAPLCLLLSWLAVFTARRGRLWFCAACWLLLAPGCALGFFAPAGLLLLLAGTAALALCRARARSWRALALPLACALLAAPFALLPTSASGLPAALTRAMHSLRYDTATQTLPEGALRDVPARTTSAAPALEITMQTPQKLYLRGFLGERYTGSGWAALENATLTDDAGTFYWLHRGGFYAQSSIGCAAQSVDITSSSTLTVTNLAACAGQQYLPYALVGDAALSPEVIGDNRTVGTRETVTLQYLPGSVPEWYALQDALAAAQETPAVAAYLAQEQQYRSFASERYLQLTPEAAAAAAQLLEGHLTGRTLPELRTAVLDALEATLTYDEAAVTHCGDADFLQALLLSGARGYDVHYASAAVLLLRACGVPARYVEGYYLSAADAAALSADRSVVLTEQNAHAWAEYYLDGVGWVPFEVTPGYMDDEECTSSVAAEREYENHQLPPPVQQQPEREQPRRAHANAWLSPVLLAALLLISAVLRTVFRRRRLKRRLAALEAAPPRDAAAGWYGYAVYLQQKTGLALPDEAAAAINREALFSDHPITAAQAAQARRYADAVRALCRTRKPWQRFSDRCIRCIY